MAIAKNKILKKKPAKTNHAPPPGQVLPYAAKYEKSVAAESFKILRTNLHFAIKFDQPRAILVTSPSQMEGKTTVSSNLAVAFAASNYKVLLIDCDMRIPNLHRQFGMDNTQGLSLCLNGDLPLDQAIQPTSIANLHLLSSGPIPPNSSELLGSEKMIQLLDELKKRFPVIIIDSPPVNIVADTPIVSSLTDGVLLVVSAGNTTRRDLRKAMQSLEYCPVLGFILNVIRKGSEGYYYQSYYNRYYTSRSR